MEDLQVEDFNDPIEHKAEQTADGIKAVSYTHLIRKYMQNHWMHRHLPDLIRSAWTHPRYNGNIRLRCLADGHVCHHSISHMGFLLKYGRSGDLLS